MFNPGQKLLAWALTLSLIVVVVTGIQAWSAHTGEGGLHGSAVVLTALLLGAHLFMAIVNPATRPALAGMAFGRVRRSGQQSITAPGSTTSSTQRTALAERLGPGWARRRRRRPSARPANW